MIHSELVRQQMFCVYRNKQRIDVSLTVSGDYIRGIPRDTVVLTIKVVPLSLSFVITIVKGYSIHCLFVLCNLYILNIICTAAK